MSDIENFDKKCSEEIALMGRDEYFKSISIDWINYSAKHNYSYHFKWLGLPIIQYPQDIVAMQEIIWQYKPDVIVETGVARGGSLTFYASLLAQLDMVDALEKNESFNPRESKRKVVGIDIDLREHNRKNIEGMPFSYLIDLVQGSSISKETIETVRNKVKGAKQVLVCLDSNHTESHVYKELLEYSKLVSSGGYLIVFDTVVEYMDQDLIKEKEWSKGNSPLSAVEKFLAEDNSFVLDESISSKLMLTVCPKGFLKKL